MPRLHVFLFCIACACAKAFLEDQLPLELVRITPSEQTISLDAQTKDVKPFKLQGANPLTAIFSRPVIALGSDWGADQLSELPEDKVPFLLTLADGTPLSSKVSGKFRWPTTYTARFDPDYNWPSDLEIVLTLNPALRSYDGVKVSVPKDVNSQMRFSTDALTGNLGTVASAMASQLSGGKWSPYFASSTYKDVPKEMKNTPEVPPDGTIELQFSQGVSKELLQSSLQMLQGKTVITDFDIKACVNTPPPVTPYLRYSSSSSSSSTDSDNKFASNDPKCHLIVPKNLQSQTLYKLVLPKGSLYNAFSGATSEAIEFEFTGLQPFMFVFKTNGVSTNRWDLFLVHGLKEATTVDQVKQGISVVDSRMKAVAFDLIRPNNGTLQISSSFQPDQKYTIVFQNKYLVDGFGQTLQNKGSNAVQTNSLPGFFESVYAMGNKFTSFEKSQWAWDSWKIFSRGSTSRSGSTEAISVGPVTQFNIPSALGSATNSRQAFPTKTSTVRKSKGSTTYSIAEARLPGNNFVVEKKTSWADGETQIVTVTDISASAVRSDDSITVWVTNFETGENVQDATVQIFEQPKNTWGQKTKDPTLLHTGKTGSFGTMTWPSKMPDAITIVASKGDATFSILDQWFYSNNQRTEKAAVVTDRAVYKQGDTIFLTSYMRDLSGNTWELPAGYESQLEVTWAQGKAPDWKPITATYPVTWSPVYGTFTTEIQIPEGATSGQKYISLQSKSSSQKYNSQIASTKVLIADPRRPTATMELSGESPVIRLSAPSFQLTSTVKTGTEQPIDSAVVQVKWTYTAYTDGKSVDKEGVFEMTTDKTGVATEEFDLAASVDDPQASANVCFDATWVGPTGELTQQNVCALVQESDWTITVAASPQPIAGVKFGVTGSIRDAQGNEVMKEKLRVQLFDGDKPISECQVTSDGGKTTQCYGDFVMPEAKTYFLVATSTDDDDQKIVSNVTIDGGKLVNNWNGGIVVQLDKSTYKRGDTAKVSFVSPFVGAKMLFVYGNAPYTKMSQMEVKQGPNSAEIPVDAKACEYGCSIAYVLSIPRQPETFAAIPDTVKFASSFDVYQPKFVGQSLTINVEDPDHTIKVQVDTVKSAQPGETVNVEVKLMDHNGKPASGEVVVYVVDQAFLDVEPYPQPQLDNTFSVSNTDTYRVGDSRESLYPFSMLTDRMTKTAERIAEDPWSTPPSSWQDESTEDYLKGQVAEVTQFQSSYSGSSPSYGYGGFGGGGYGGFPEAVSYASKSSSMAMESAPMAMMMDSADASPQKARSSRPAAAPMADSSASQSPEIPVRSKFEIVPLFKTLMVAGTASVALKLPGNIGAFSIRAYAVDTTSHFGQNETKMTVAKEINLQPLFPRFARSGDQFESGVIVFADDVNFDQDVKVSVQSLASSLGVDGIPDQTVKVVGTTPVQVRFDMSAAAVGDTKLKFVASAVDATPDALEDGFEIEPTQDPVTIATSMAIEANAAGTPWEEAIDIPAMLEGTGSLAVAASVGRFAAVQANADVLFKRADVKLNENANLWISRALMSPVLKTYKGESLDTKSAALLKNTATALSSLTDPSLGIRYSTKYPASEGATPSFSLNAYALFVAMMDHLQKEGHLAHDRFVDKPGARPIAKPTSPPTLGPEDYWGGDSYFPQEPSFDMGFLPEDFPMPMPMPMPIPRPTRGRHLLQRGIRPPPPQFSKPFPSGLAASPAAAPSTKPKPVPSGSSKQELLDTWKVAMSNAMTYKVWNAKKYGNEFSDWNSLAQSIMIFGLDWSGSSSAPNVTRHGWSKETMSTDVGKVLNLQQLAANADKLSVTGMAYYSLAFLLRPEATQQKHPQERALVNQMISSVQSLMRLQGRTAYIQQSPTSSHAAPMVAQALWLQALSPTAASDAMTEKLANYVAQGSRVPSPWSPPANLALASLGLSAYDAASQNTNPNVKLGVRSGTRTIMDAQFTSPSDPVAQSATSMDDLPRTSDSNGVIVPSPINFIAKGTGEVTTALTMTFVPADISADPIYRGIYVERAISHVDDLGDVVSGTTQMSKAGDFVKITLQITTPDDLIGVEVVDLLPGGLEPLDPNLQASPDGQNSPNAGWWWRPPTFGPRQTLPDRIIWGANNLPAGTHTVSYTALAVTPGVFLHPPSKASVLAQPELLGLSGGGYFVVTEDDVPVAEEQAYLEANGIPVQESTIPKECAEACAEDQACNLRTGTCETVAAMQTVQLMARSTRMTMRSASAYSMGSPAEVSVSAAGSTTSGATTKVVATGSKSPVRFLKPFNRKANAITLIWVAPKTEGAGCQDVSYTVQHRLKGASEWATSTVESEFAVLEGLSPSSVYQFRVTPMLQGESLGPAKQIKARTTDAK